MSGLFGSNVPKQKALPDPKVVRKPTQDDVTEAALQKRKKAQTRGGRGSTVLTAEADKNASDGQTLGA